MIPHSLRSREGGLLVVAVVIMALVATMAVGGAAQQPTPPHAVYGSVTDQNGDAVADVTVEAVYDGDVIASTQAASDGSYDFKVPDPDDGQSGESFTVRVANGDDSETVTYQSGGVTEVNLQSDTGTAPTTTTDEPDDTTTPTPTTTTDEPDDTTTSTPTTTTDDGDDDSGGGGFPVDPPDEDDDTTTAEPTTEPDDGGDDEADVEPTPDGGAQVDISAPSEGGQFDANFSGTGVADAGDDGVALEGLNGSTSGTASLTVTKGQAADVPGLSDSVVGYINVEESTGGSVTDVTFRFTVQAATLEQRGVAPEDVSLYRYSGGEWTELETTLVGSTAQVHRYTAHSPGFSAFAVAPRGVEQQEPTTTEEPTTSTTEEPTTSTTSEPSTTDEPSTSEPTPTTETTEPSEETTTEEPTSGTGSGGIPGFTTGITLVALLAAALLALRRP
mgnify:CR=1 FL=1